MSSGPLETPAGTADRPAKTAVTLGEALARLERSRTLLRQALTPAAPGADGAGPSGFHPFRRARAWLRGTAWGGLLDPLLGALGDEAANWWQRQPWRQAAVQLKDSVTGELSPLVRRYPVAAVLVTAALGATVAGSGLWRWRAVRRSAWRLGAQLRRACVHQLANPALQSLLLAALLSALAPRQRQEATAKEPGPPDAAASP